MIYLTKHKYTNIETPRIKAANWNNAETQANIMDLEVIGEFISEFEINNN